MQSIKAHVRFEKKERTCLKVLLYITNNVLYRPVSLVPPGFIFCHINCSCLSSREKTEPCFVVEVLLFSVLWQFSRFFTTVIPDYRHI